MVIQFGLLPNPGIPSIASLAGGHPGSVLVPPMTEISLLLGAAFSKLVKLPLSALEAHLASGPKRPVTLILGCICLPQAMLESTHFLPAAKKEN